MLQHDMNVCRLKQILTTHNMGNLLRGVIEHDGQMIRGAHVAACQDNIANCFNHVTGIESERSLSVAPFLDKLEGVRQISTSLSNIKS